MPSLLLLSLISVIDNFEIEETIEYTPEIIRRIERFKENPVNINNASRRELIMIPYINRYIAEKIIHHREMMKFEEVSDILQIPDINLLIYDRIKPFITVKSPYKKFEIPEELEWLSRLQFNFEDSQNKFYNRFEIPVLDLSAGFICEKDYSEKNYFDYISFSLNKPGNFIIGDFDLDYGMGLVYGKPGFFYSGSGIIPGESGFTPHLSTYEENFFRGLVGKYRNFTFFGSFTETSKYGVEKTGGFSYMLSPFRVTASYQNYADTMNNLLSSIFFEKEFGGNILRAELASGGSSMREIKRNLSCCFGFNNGNGLQIIYSNISDSLPTNRNAPFRKNEELFYVNYEKKINPVLTGGLYAELTREDTSLAKYEREFGLNATVKPIKRFLLRMRFKNKPDKSNIRLDILYRKNNYYLKTRFEMSNYLEEYGYLYYAGFRYSRDYIYELRFIIYETGDWNSRIYEYENDLPGTFTIKQLYGSGRRIYLLLGQKKLPFKTYLKWGIDIKEKIHQKVGIAITI